MSWWVLWYLKGGGVEPMRLDSSGGMDQFPRGIRQYVRRWAEARAAGHHWRGHAWDTGAHGRADHHTFIRLHFVRHAGLHHQVWAAFAHHSHLITVVIHVR